MGGNEFALSTQLHEFTLDFADCGTAVIGLVLGIGRFRYPRRCPCPWVSPEGPVGEKRGC